MVAVVVIGFVLAFGWRWADRGRGGQLRRAIRDKDVTCRVALEDVTVTAPGRRTLPRPIRNGDMQLVVRGDSLEISSALLPLRALFGLEYYFLASETTFRLVKDSRRGSSIVLTGRRLGKDIQIDIRTNRRVWHALVTAGAVPVEPTEF
jgi:hypothetical protein